MKWTNHLALTMLLTYSLTGDMAASAVSTAGAILPDTIENVSPGSRHRQTSHWPYPYVAVMVLLHLGYLAGYGVVFLYSSYLFFGAFCHLSQDWLSKTGIPLGRAGGCRKGAGFYTLYSWRETVTASVIGVASVALIVWCGYANAGYIAGEVAYMSKLGRTIFCELAGG